MTQAGKHAWQDSRSIESIVTAIYSILSGPAGEKDWARFGALFIPDARLIRVTVRSDGVPIAKSMDFAGYRADTIEMFRRESFYELDICRRVEQFGHIAHVYSTFEARRGPQDTTPTKRGLNSIQLFFDQRRWWVVSILWENEAPCIPLPARYLPADG